MGQNLILWGRTNKLIKNTNHSIRENSLIEIRNNNIDESNEDRFWDESYQYG